MNILDLEILSHTLRDYLALVPPALLLGFLLAGFESVAYHVLFGRGDRSTLWYLGIGCVGFWLGHLAAAYVGAVFQPVGTLPAGEASMVCVTLLYLADYVRS